MRIRPIQYNVVLFDFNRYTYDYCVHFLRVSGLPGRAKVLPRISLGGGGGYLVRWFIYICVWEVMRVSWLDFVDGLIDCGVRELWKRGFFIDFVFILCFGVFLQCIFWIRTCS